MPSASFSELPQHQPRLRGGHSLAVGAQGHAARVAAGVAAADPDAVLADVPEFDRSVQDAEDKGVSVYEGDIGNPALLLTDRGESLRRRQVPDHRGLVATGGGQRLAVGTDRQRVDLVRVAGELGDRLPRLQVPEPREVHVGRGQRLAVGRESEPPHPVLGRGGKPGARHGRWGPRA